MKTIKPTSAKHALRVVATIAEVSQHENAEYDKQLRERLRSSIVDIEAMLAGYLVCALWASIGEDERPLDAKYFPTDIDEESQRAARETCKDFVGQAIAEGLLLEAIYPQQSSNIGHDLWLTRNHHGTGFWDRGFGEAGAVLTKLAHHLGESNAYEGDDGKVHLT
jgi:hypothetical protein